MTPVGPSCTVASRMRNRLSAWLVCGPLGHLAAGVTDWVVLLVRWRLAERQARTREISSR